MSTFEDIFLESKGQPVEYNGQVIQMGDFISVVDGKSYVLIFESTNSEWKQGVYLTGDCEIEINNQKIRKRAVIWKDTAPEKVEFRVFSSEGKFCVRNVWDCGDGVMESWHNGAAMIVEEIDNGRRYRCNDGHPDDDFDDLIFRIEWPK